MTEMITHAKKTLVHAISQPEGTQADYLDAQRHQIRYTKGGFTTLLNNALEALEKGRELELMFREAESRANGPAELQWELQKIELSGEVPEDPGDRMPVVADGEPIGYVDKMDLVRMAELIGRYQDDDEEITAETIWKKYWDARDRKGLKMEVAYQEIESWLLRHLTKKEVKERFKFTLEQEAFTKLARNKRPHSFD